MAEFEKVFKIKVVIHYYLAGNSTHYKEDIMYSPEEYNCVEDAEKQLLKYEQVDKSINEYYRIEEFYKLKK